MPPGTSDTQSSLSSAPTDVTAYVSKLHDARGRLESYTATRAEDYTIKLLSAFLECLPMDGVMHIAEDILNTGSSNNDAGLRALAEHLLTAVLVPSMTPGTLQCYISLTSLPILNSESPPLHSGRTITTIRSG